MPVIEKASIRLNENYHGTRKNPDILQTPIAGMAACRPECADVICAVQDPHNGHHFAIRPQRDVVILFYSLRFLNLFFDLLFVSPTCMVTT